VSIDDLPRGVVVGTVEIIDCVQDGDDYEWHLANPQRLAVPLPPQEHLRATEHAGGKPWKYLLIPHNEIDESKTLAGLAASWDFHALISGVSLVLPPHVVAKPRSIVAP